MNDKSFVYYLYTLSDLWHVATWREAPMFRLLKNKSFCSKCGRQDVQVSAQKRVLRVKRTSFLSSISLLLFEYAFSCLGSIYLNFTINNLKNQKLRFAILHLFYQLSILDEKMLFNLLLRVWKYEFLSTRDLWSTFRFCIYWTNRV